MDLLKIVLELNTGFGMMVTVFLGFQIYEFESCI